MQLLTQFSVTSVYMLYINYIFREALPPSLSVSLRGERRRCFFDQKKEEESVCGVVHIALFILTHLLPTFPCCNIMEHSFSSIPISDKAGPSPVDNASFLSIVFFSWFTPLIRLGAKRPLEIHDIYEVPVSHLTTSSLSLFTGHYWRGPASLGVDLTMCFSTPLLLSNVVFLLYVGSSILQPFFVSTILEYVSNGHAVILGISSGVWIVLLLGAIGLVGILAFSMGFYYIQEFALYVRNTCIALIFSKSLRISSGSRSTHTTGEIVTLISVDAERIFNGVLLSTWYWMGPLLILGALILLIFQMGVIATLICCGVLLAWFWFQMNGKYKLFTHKPNL